MLKESVMLSSYFETLSLSLLLHTKTISRNPPFQALSNAFRIRQHGEKGSTMLYRGLANTLGLVSARWLF